MALSVFSDEHYMKEAYKQAVIALEEGEVPVGAVVVSQNRIIAKAYNQVEKLGDATAHAEILAITSAANHLGTKYLKDCTLYVTLEPCIMCAGATYWSQLGRLVFGAQDIQKGYSRLIRNEEEGTITHPKTDVTYGLMAEDCKLLIDEFFRNIRNK